MHFLAHYLTVRHKQRPYLTMGSLLPDIAPHFTRTYNTRIRNQSGSMEPFLAELQEGVIKHFRCDALFHASTAFKEACSVARQHLLATGMDRQRLRFWFLGHLSVEVLMDLMLMEEMPSLVEEYYGVLSLVDINKFDAYLNFLLPEHEKNAILSTFIRFMEIGFLRHTGTESGAAEGISRTLHRVAGIAMQEHEKALLAAALHNIRIDKRYSVEKLLNAAHEG